MSDYTPKRAATQVEHPWRATLRTGVAVLLGPLDGLTVSGTIEMGADS